MSRLLNRIFGRVHGWFDANNTHAEGRALYSSIRLKGIPGLTRHARLVLQHLEDRVVPATFTVFNTADSGPGSLRDAISQANAAAGADIIVFNTDSMLGTDFSAGPNTITLSSALSTTATAGNDLTIIGPGANLLTLNASTTGFRAFTVGAGGNTFELQGVTISGFTGTGTGGAINVGSTSNLILDGVHVTGNVSGAASGGAIYLNNGKHKILNSTISNNSSGNTAVGGGGIRRLGTTATNELLIFNSTISGNTSASHGGGISIANAAGVVSIINSTITDNVSQVTTTTNEGHGGGGLGRSAGTSAVTVNIENSIIADNNATNGRHDLALFNNVLTTNMSNSVIGVYDSTLLPLNTDVNNKTGTPLSKLDPVLGALTDNGGTTPTHLPGKTSPAVDLYNPGVEGKDQRGNLRPAVNADAGSVELDGPSAPTAVPGGLVNVSKNLAGTNNPYTFTVTYADPDLISRVTIGNLPDDDVQVVREGGGFSVIAQFVSADKATDDTKITATYKFTPPGGSWDSADNGKYSIVMLADTVFNTKSVAVPAGAIGSFTVNVAGPAASGSGATVFFDDPSTNPYKFTVTYTDGNALDVNSLSGANKNEVVRVIGPGGVFNVPATFVSIDNNTDGTPRTVTYQITPPGGTWDAADAGSYSIEIQASKAKNINGTFVPAGSVGSFAVDIGTTLLVTNTNDSGPGSLRDAINQANLTTAADVIVFSDGSGGSTDFGTPQTIVLTSGELTITNPLIIQGKGPNLLTVTPTAGRVFSTIPAPLNALITISGMTISGGSAASGGNLAIENEQVKLSHVVVTSGTASSQGGNIHVSDAAGSLTLDCVTVSNGKSAAGGGIFVNGGKLLIENSTIVNNSTTVGNVGGGIRYIGSVPTDGFIIRNSTLYGNSGAFHGGAIGFASITTGNALIENTTITNNTAGGANGKGGGIGYNAGTGTVTLVSSIVSGNVSLNFPLLADIGSTVLPQIHSNRSAIGKPDGFVHLSSTMDLPFDIDLKMNPLADNGGPTETVSFLPFSPLRNAGSNPSGAKFDQRGTGFQRESPAGLPDIGAFEFQSTGEPFASVSGLVNVNKNLPGVNNPYTFTITYFDDVAVSRATIGNSPNDDIEIAKVGGGFTAVAEFVSADSAVDAPIINATYKFTPPGGKWDGFDNGTYEIRTLAGGVSNTSSKGIGAATLGSFHVNFPLPTAAASAAKVIFDDASTNPYKFTVTYTDLTAMDVSTLSGAGKNSVVRVVGPSFDAPATFMSIDNNTDGSPRTVTYQIIPPGGTWDPADNGTYSIEIQPNTAKNTDGLAVPAGSAGNFVVSIATLFLVTNTNDSGTGSLRDAIELANLNPGIDAIVFSDGTGGTTNFNLPQTITLATGQLNITDDLVIFGKGANLLTVSGGGLSRVFNISNTASLLDVTISGMKITGGVATGRGGGIFADNEKLTLDGVHLADNTASTQGGGIGFNSGGNLTLLNSTVSGNKGTAGGGIYFTTIGTAFIRNSTLSGNTASSGVGGGLAAVSTSGSSTFTVLNSTVTNNSSSSTGGGLRIFGAATNITITSSVVSGNSGTAASKDLYLSSGNIATVTFSAIGAVSSLPANTANNRPFGEPVDLGPLANNGGPTPTHLPNPGSPLINNGTNPAPAAAFDQRGTPFVRQVGSGVDIGSVEVQPPSVTSILVNNGAPQRSRLTSITVTFSGPVSPTSFTSLGAITLTRTLATPTGTVGTLVRTGATGANGLINVAQPGPTNQLVLTFSNADGSSETAGVEYGSLADGRWQLTIPSAGYTSVLNDPQLRRLFGDFEAGPPGVSNGTVDSGDFGSLGTVFGSSPGVGVSPFDYDNNGAIDSIDFAAFGARFGISV